MQSDTLLDNLPLTVLSGVGVAMSERLSRLGISSVQDLLFHFPFRYQDRTHITPLRDLRPESYATIEGIVQTCEVQRSHRPMLLVSLSDGSAKIMLRFFNFNAGMKNSFSSGVRVKAFGEVRRGRFMAEMHHPEYQIITHNQPLTMEENLTPIYPSTEGLRQASWRKLIDQALILLAQKELRELLPAQFNPTGYDLKTAIQFLHHPPAGTLLSSLEKGEHPAQIRLAFEELLAHHLAMRQSKQDAQQCFAKPLKYQSDIKQKFLQTLPFKPTNAQLRVTADIEQDLQKSQPMMRLIQGDVGSGKTLVALLAALVALDNAQQVAIMAPTEILAEQHFYNFSQWLTPFGIQIGWLAGKVKGKKRQQVLAQIQTGEVQVVIGTHALFQEQVEFADLSLVIIDEQHRFGVEQRLMLREKGEKNGVYPHQLIMTATPIPRTLAMTVYADLDISVIDELPPGRTPIKTIAIAEDRRNELVQKVHRACRNDKRQVYWVCTLIDESEVLEAQAAEALAEDLKKALPDLRIGLVHGRMKPQEKQEVMHIFKAGEIDVLVATTVIEVGVDVPNASLMIIENAERLGLSQLHQLRGRVGRGQIESFCVLLYKAPLGKISRQRLEIMRTSNDGFAIAEKDLEIRGPGEVLGVKQTGAAEFRVADLVRDRRLLPAVQCCADQLIAQQSSNINLLIQRWLQHRTVYSNA